LRSVNIATVVASGNESTKDAISSPGCISTAISVGATFDTSDTVAGYSNSSSILNLLAPGSGITSAVPGGGYGTWSGTSMATPHVAGAWAVLKQKAPTASVTEILNALASTGVSVTDTNGIAKPRIKIDAALATPGVATPPLAPTTLVATPVSTTRIGLTWVDTANNETGFYLQRKTGVSGIWVTIAILGQNVASYQDATGLAAATSYFYRISSYNSGGQSANSNEANATTLSVATPTGLTATAVSSAQINLAWVDSSDNEANFRVLRRLSSATTWTTVATLPANTASYQNTGLTAATTYVYAVAAVHANGNVATSTSVTAVTPSSVFVAPTNLVATTYNSNQVNLTWTDNTGVETGYRIFKRVTSPTSTTLEVVTTIAANSTSYSVTGLNQSTNYTFAVAAVDSAGALATSSTVTATTTANPMIAPTGVTAVTFSDTQINLAWTDTTTDETGFRVLRRPNNGSSTPPPWTIVTTTEADVTTYEDNGAASATSYAYAIASINAIGDYAISSTATARTLSTALSAPSDLSAKAETDILVNLTWKDTTVAETGYRVLRKVTTSTAAAAVVATLDANATSYADNGLVAATGYTYTVVAFDAAGKTAASSSVSVTTKAEVVIAPSGLTATPVNSNQVDLTWVDNSANEVNFRILRKLASASEFTVVATLAANTTSYSVNDLNGSTSYTFVVSAIGGSKSVSNSTPVTATTLANPMVAPTGVTAVTSSDTQINLAWTDMTTNETGFRVLRRPNDGSSTPAPWTIVTTTAADVTTYEDKGLTQNSGYAYAIASINAIGDYAISSTATARTLSTALSAPSDLAAKAETDILVNLTWKDTTVAETGYRVLRKVTSSTAAAAIVATLDANATSYADSNGLVAATGYTYTVVAFDAAGKTAASGSVNVTTKAEVVIAPSGLTATPVNSNQVDLTWVDNSANEVNFRILRKLASASQFTVVATLGANTTSYSVKDLNGSTSYTFVVSAIGGSKSVSNSTPVTATTLANPMVAPNGVTAVTISDKQINLAWTDKSTDETGFRVLRRLTVGTSSEFAPWEIVTTTAADVTFYEDKGAASATRYTYAIASINAIGDYAISAIAMATTLSTALSAPSDLAAKAETDILVNLTWKDTTVAETGYRVLRKLSSSTAAAAIVATLDANATSYADNGLVAATRYTYTVVAFDAAGKTAASSSVSVTTKPEVVNKPTGLTATPVNSNQVDLTWIDNSANEGTFRILRILPLSNSGFLTTEIATLAANTTSYSVKDLNGSTSYIFVVSAVGRSGSVSSSGEVTATTLANPMVAPTGVTAVTFSDTQINLAWTDTTPDETGFRILRRPNNVLSWNAPWEIVTTTAAGLTTYEDKGLTQNSGYAYAIASINAIGDYAISSTAAAKTHSTLLSAPSDLLATAETDILVKLTWKDTTMAETGYRVLRKVTSSTAAAAIVATLDANVTSYADSNGLVAATGYTYTVVAFDAAGKTAASNTGVTTKAEVVNAPSGLTATPVNSNQIDLTWVDNSANEVNFRILRLAASNTVIATLASNSTSYSVKDLNGSTRYAFMVLAIGGSKSVSSSAPVSATTLANPMVAPTGVTAVTISDTQINLAWTDMTTDETGFRVLRRPNNGSSTPAPWTIVTTTEADVTTYEDNGAASATSYTYAIASINAIGDYAISSTATARTLSTALSAPSDLSAKAETDILVNLTWKDTTVAETGYRVLRKLTSSTAAAAIVATLDANATSYADSNGLVAATGYTYTVVAFDAAGKTAASGSVSVTTKAEVVNKPTGLTATPVNSNQVDLTWVDNSANEVNFRILRKLASASEFTVVATLGANKTSYSVNDLNGSTSYTFVVSAIGGSKTVSSSTPVTAATSANPMIAPTGVTAVPFSNTQVTLRWTDASTDEVGFRVLRRLNSASNWTIVTTTTPDAIFYSDTGLTASTSYTYAVASVNASGDFAISATTEAITQASTLTAPISVVATVVSDTQINLNWKDTTVAETGYRVLRRKSSVPIFTTIATLAANTLIYSDTNLVAATSYVYAVVAIDTAGKTASSSTVTATTKPQVVNPPTRVVATVVSPTQVRLTWTDNSNNESGFRILRRLISGTTFTLVTTLPANTTSYLNIGLTAATGYTYAVAAVSAAGTVATSSPINITTSR
jgi:titin